MTPIARPAIALRSADVLHRQRIALASLLVAAAASLLLAFAAHRSAIWGLQVLVDAVLVGYVVMLVRLRNVAARQEMTLRSDRRVPAQVPLAGRTSGDQ